MNYLKSFNNNTDYKSDQPNFLHPHVSFIKDERRVIYEKTAPSHDYSKDYLTFEALESGTFRFSGNSVNYSLDSGTTWTSLASNTDTPTVNAGEKIMFKATLVPSYGIGRFSSTGTFNAMGNPYSLIDGDNFSGMTASTAYALYKLFDGCTGLTSAENVSLPATTLAVYCYNRMFAGCTSLTTSPELPATTLVESCYSRMFNGCTSLTTAPALPATTLGEHCYDGMFFGCTAMTTAPILSAATLAVQCYQSMFEGCTSLNYIKMLATDISASQCLNRWVVNVASSGTFVKDASMTLPTGYSGIPDGWAVINN